MLCPSDIGSSSIFRKSEATGEWARGNYAVNGFQFWPDSRFVKQAQGRDDSSPNMTPYLDYIIGMGAVNVTRSISQISDGTTNTIMLAELRVGLSERDRRGVWAMGNVWLEHPLPTCIQWSAWSEHMCRRRRRRLWYAGYYRRCWQSYDAIRMHGCRHRSQCTIDRTQPASRWHICRLCGWQRPFHQRLHSTG